MGASSSDRDRARVKKARRRSAPELTGGLGLLIGLAVAVAAFRILVALDLAQSPLILRPALEDGVYLSEIAAAEDGKNVLPRGSLLYPHLGSLFPGAADGDLDALRVAQGLVEGLTTLVVALWVRRRLGLAPAVAASALYLLDPIGGFFAARLSPVVWSTLLLAVSLAVYDLGRERVGTVRLWITGALFGLGLLLSPLLFTLAALATAWDRYKSTRATGGSEERVPTSHPRRLTALGSVVLGPAALVLPLAILAGLVLLRNDGVPGGGPTLSYGSGISAYRAASPATGGTERALAPPSWESDLQARTVVFEALEREVDDYHVHRFYATRAFQQVIENPVETIGVLLTKAAGTIGAWPLPDALSPSFLVQTEAGYLGYGMFSFAVLLGLAAGGFLLTRGEAGVRVLVLGLVAVGITSAVGPASAAARQAALPLLAALGGVWSAGWRDRGRRALSPASPKVAGAVCAGLVISVVAGYLSPTSVLRNPSEDYRLAASSFAGGANWRPAIPLLEHAVEARPSNLEARAALARLYQQDGLVNAALEQLNTAFAADSTHVPTLLTLAGIEMTQNNPPRALDLMARVVNAHPNNPLFLNEYGGMLLRTGQIASAQSFLRRALEIKPDYGVAKDNLRLVEEMLQRMEQAVYPPEMRLAFDDPLNAIPELSVRAMGAGNWDQADSLIRVIESARADIVLPHFLRAAYHARRNETAAAVAALERCQELAPCRPIVIEYLASLYSQAGRAAEAFRVVTACERSATEEEDKRAFAAIRQSLESPPGP